MKNKHLCGRLLAGALVVALSATSASAPAVVFAEEIQTSADEATSVKVAQVQAQVQIAAVAGSIRFFILQSVKNK